MKHQIIFLASLFFSLTTSCNSQERIYENKLKECINKKFNDDTYKLDNAAEVDYFSIVVAMEEYFLSKGLSKGITKENYLNLITNIFKADTKKQKELYTELIQIANNNNYNGLYFSTDVLQNCPHFILNMEGNKIGSMERQFSEMDKLFAFDPYGQEYIKKLVEVVDENDFKRLTYRVPIITILFEYLGHLAEEN